MSAVPATSALPTVPAPQARGEAPSARLVAGRRTSVLALLYLAVVLIWGTTWYGMKVSVETFPPLTAAGLRFTLAFPLLLAGAWLVPGWRLLPPPGSRWLVPLLTVSYVAVPYGLINWGEQRTSSGLAALIFASVTVLLVVLSQLLGTVRVTVAQWCAIVVGLGLLALLVVQSGDALGARDVAGPVAVFGAAALHALSYALIARYGRAATVFSLEVLPIGVGGALLLGAGLLTERADLSSASGRSWLAVAYLAVVASVVGFALYFYLLQRVSPVLLSFVFILFPIVALALSAWLEKLRVTPLMVLTVAAALTAFALAGRSRRDRPELGAAVPLDPAVDPAMVLNDDALVRICHEAVAAWPSECCGFVTATGVRPATNVADSATTPDGTAWQRRSTQGYVLGDDDLRYLHDSLDGEDPVRFLYHSHPNGRAYFSEEDTAFALYEGVPVLPLRDWDLAPVPLEVGTADAGAPEAGLAEVAPTVTVAGR